MTQDQALAEAIESLRSHARGGNDDAELAAFVIEKMLADRIRQRVKNRCRARHKRAGERATQRWKDANL